MDARLRKLIHEILEGETDLSLATIRPDGAPQANVVSYASEGMVLYFGTYAASQKIVNIRHSSRVALTITPAYEDWNHIRGLSISAVAEVLARPADVDHAVARLSEKFPVLWDAPALEGPDAMAFVRLVPMHVSVLDYTRGFGHTDLLEL
jgi:PPOX class probable F420-dependent enzyme